MQTHDQKIQDSHLSSITERILELAINHYTILFLIITLVSFAYKMLFSSNTIIEAFLMCFLTWNVGVRGLVAFAANWIPKFANPIAVSYGWPVQSSFQREIAASEGAFGILGIMSNWIRGDFWTATVIAVSFCWFVSELGGLIKMSKLKKDPNYHLNKSLQRGMRIDFIFSILLPIFLLMWKQGY